jgi:transposase
MDVWMLVFFAFYFSKVMLHLSALCHYYLYREATDMRKGFDGLCGMVQNHLGKNAMSGDVFIFLNKRRNQIKLLLWEGDGFSLYYKRLERGTYELPTLNNEDRHWSISHEQLLFILQGISLKHVRKRKRYQHINNLDP